MVTEIDPICALQAAMEGYEVVTMEEAVKRCDIFVTATGNEDVITAEHMKAMKPMAIVCNIGHFDSEIQIAALDNYEWDEVKPGTDLVDVPRRQEDHHPGQGPPGEPRLRHRPPELRDELQLHQPDAGADRAVHQGRANTSNEVYVLPKHLDEKVAALHLDKLGVKLTKLSQRQADYIGVPVERAVQARSLPLLSASRSSPATRGGVDASTSGRVTQVTPCHPAHGVLLPVQ